MAYPGLVLFGAALLGVLWFSPAANLAGGPFSAHMVRHMGVVAVAAPALALGLAGTKLDPVRAAPRLFAPVQASIVELLVVWIFHTPALHHAARQSASWFAVEQIAFLGSGLFLWLSAFGGEETRRRERTAAGVVALVLTSMHMTLLGALLAFPPRALYAPESELAALAPLQDQHLGGAIMLLVGGVVYLLGGLGLAARLLRGRESPA
jgi:putative membrane protein